MAGGLLIGLAEQFILAYWSPNVAPLGGIIILVVALMIRPQGLFTRRREPEGLMANWREFSRQESTWSRLDGASRA